VIPGAVAEAAKLLVKPRSGDHCWGYAAALHAAPHEIALVELAGAAVHPVIDKASRQ